MKMSFAIQFLTLQAERDAGIREAVCQKETMDVKYKADAKVEGDTRNLKLSTAAFNKYVK